MRYSTKRNLAGFFLLIAVLCFVGSIFFMMEIASFLKIKDSSALFPILIPLSVSFLTLFLVAHWSKWAELERDYMENARNNVTAHHNLVSMRKEGGSTRAINYEKAVLEFSAERDVELEKLFESHAKKLPEGFM